MSDCEKCKELRRAINRAIEVLDTGNTLLAAGILEQSFEEPGTVGWMSAQRLIDATRLVANKEHTP